MRLARLLLLLLLLTGLALSACDLNEENGTVTPTVAALQVPTVVSTPAQVTPIIQTPGTPPVSRAITLTLWTAPELAPDPELPGGAVLAEQLEIFDSDHSQIHLVIETKTVSDQGGILSYLRTGRSVAPTILPDIVTLPAGQLSSAAAQGLIYPIDPYLESGMTGNLFPAAQSLSQVDGRIYGYPFALTNIQHLVYNSRLITETVSTEWSELTAAPPGRLIFPAAGIAGAELTMQFYLENGGSFLNDAGQSTIQLTPLIAALEEIRNGVNSNLIVTESGSTSSIEQAWQIFQNNPQFMVQTTASHFLQQLATSDNIDYELSPLPGLTGASTPRVSAWTWAISTPDPSRQAAAAELLHWLGSTSNIGAWTQASAMLPSQPGSLDEWPDGAYVSFLEEQLQAAEPAPPGLNSTVMQALSQATSTVILGLSSPDEAAAQAIESLEQ